MLRRLGVRGKILATLAVPIFVLLVAASYISWGALQEASSAGQTSELVDSLELQDRAGTAMARERALAVVALNGSEDATDSLVEAQEQTDEAIDARNAALADLDTDALNVNVRDAISATLEDRRSVDELQTDVLSGQISEQDATARYTALIERALDVPRSVSAASTNLELSEHLNAYIAMDEVMLANTYERPIVALGLADAARADAEDEDRNAELMSRMVNALQDTDALRVDAQEQVDRLGLGIELPEYSSDLDDLRFRLSYQEFSNVDQQAAASWSELSDAWIAEMQPVRDEIRAETVAYAQDVSSSARTQAIGTMAATFGIVLLSVVLALVIARRIVSPLRRLTTATADVRERLPRMVEQMAVPGQAPADDLVQIPVESSDEIGRLANAFNQVNSTTMEIAREQAALRGSIAEMFVNVARRDQVLLNRQLAFLDDLERSEEDPGTLSNLFRLDHLATRMRRNAESLLVLAGIDSGRRVRNPMPVSDVIRTASSEIELYDRVRLDLHTDPQMLGHNALNGAHLVAELLENATMFSEPHTPVEVTTTRDERGVIVAVRDYGLGMSPEDLAAANQKVDSTAASDAVGAQRLGLFVVGRLAQRLRAVVQFSAGADGKGTLATVVFPAELFLPDEAMPLPQPTDPLESSTQQAVAQIGSEPDRPEVVGAAPATVPATAQVPVPEPAGSFESAGFSAPDTESAASPVPAPQRTDRPQPVPEPAAASSFGMPEPEAPMAQPVDLDALTDGTTATGMPRRRRAGDGPATESIVLPPLATPQMDESAEGSAEEVEWTPPREVSPAGASLPSRQRPDAGTPEADVASGAVPLLPPQEDVPAAPVDVEERTGLFSSFRSMDRLDESASESTIRLDPVSGDPSDVPEVLAVQEPEPERIQGSAETPAAEPTASDTAWLDRDEQPQNHGHDHGRAADQEQGYGALPAFEDLMSDLPTRRGDASPSSTRKRGLFGRKPAVGETAQAAAESRPTPATPVGSADGIDPLARPSRSTTELDAEPWRNPSPQPPDPFAPATAGSGSSAPVEPAPVAYQPPVVDELEYQAPRSFEPSDDAAPAVADPVSRDRGADDGDRGGGSAYGESVLPLRATSEARPGALDPHFVPDTIEARSEWMASAVLYEEMSTLMQRGVFQEGNVTIPSEEPTYRPTNVAPVSTNGLARRGQSAEQPEAAERFTARIERDPEQLRARLSAFQSATTRGRSESIG